jgi:drug/metabolite transporter (DMT)-like permease
LIVFGSIIGYSAYVYTMDRLPVAIASIYTYVNPTVAVILGWLAYNEPFGMREAIATGIIFAGVAIVKRASVSIKKLSPDRAAESGQYGE